MKELRYTLVSDGSSDVAFIPILTWLLREQGITMAIQAQWADLRRAFLPERPTLSDKIALGLQLYPCELLFVHRDAEREPREKRVEEISMAIETIILNKSVPPPAVCVVPVRMQETWLLFDQDSIKHAAGNRNNRESLELPPIRQLETLPDPKTILHDCLKRASGLSGRRLQSFPVRQRALRVADFIDDFSPLRILPAFAALEHDVNRLVQEFGWAI